MNPVVTVGPPPQSVTKLSPVFAPSTHPLVASTGRVVQGHDKSLAVAVHAVEVVQASRHSILTVKGLPSAGTSLNAILPVMLRVLELYSTVIVFIFVFWNAIFPISVQPEVRFPQLSENT